jgi:DNA modification methylase
VHCPVRWTISCGRCNLVFTDLPYNVDYTGKNARHLKLANDHLGAGFMPFLAAAFRSMLRVCEGGLYVCMSSGELHHLYTAFTDAGGHWSTYIIWAKNTFTLGRSDYQRQYEPILYGWPEGKKHGWCGARDQGDVWFIDKPHANRFHPTMKPVGLMERAILNSSGKTGVVLDPFCGSGSTLIACQNTGRRGYGLEIDPNYVDVAVKRWQAYTGQSARLASNGKSFAEIAAERSWTAVQGDRV